MQLRFLRKLRVGRDSVVGIDAFRKTYSVEPQCTNAQKGYFMRIDSWLVLAVACLHFSSTLVSPAMGQSAHLDQGWTEDDREKFYFTAQGSQLIPFKWFLALEQVGNDRLFRDNENIRQYGFLPAPPSKLNPEGLPVGFVRDGVDPIANQVAGLEPTQRQVIASATRFGIKKAYLGESFDEKLYPNEQQAWFGLTCAACHTHEVEFNSTTIRIDGGTSQADIETFLRDLGIALKATSEDADKLKRFAQSVGNNLNDLVEFKNEVGQIADAVNRLVARNKAAHPYGHARLDAFGAILNAVCETALNIPENHHESNAPVSYPSLWNTPHMAYVQWNASAANAEGRNVGEVLGVFGTYSLEAGDKQFDSTIRLRNLVMLEHELIDKLRSPDWPEKVLGKLDELKVAQGNALFDKNCLSCHSVRNKEGSFALNDAGKIPVRSNTLQEIQTDSQFLANLRPSILVKTGGLVDLFGGRAEVTRPMMLAGVVRGIITNRAKAEQVDLSQWHVGEQQPPHPAGVGTGYIARPLEGIWATAPYFHNGSVPNLYETLLPAADRSKSFWVGTRKFDPIKVGFATSRSDVGTEFHVLDGNGDNIPGNSNAGHEGHGLAEDEGFTQTFENGAWRDFTEEERYALLEYMKSLSSQPAPPDSAEDNSGTDPVDNDSGAGSDASTFELVPDGEAEQIANIVELTVKRMQLQYAENTRTLRGVHPKDHGCVTATFEVSPDLPEKYAVGIFQPGIRYDAFIRFSNADTEVAADSKEPSPGQVRHGSRGMAVKLLGVKGESLLPLHGALTQDLVMINQPAFAFANVEDYELLSQVLVDHFGEPNSAVHFFQKRFTAGTSEQKLRAQRTQQIVARIAAGEVSGDTGAFFQPPASAVDNPYFSASVFAFGSDRVMRFRANPVNRSHEKPDVSDPDYLRNALIKRLQAEEVVFDFAIQVRTADQLDIATDIENASSEWNDDYLSVAKITIPIQEFDAPEQREKCEKLFFTPWHGIKEHQPLGGINRLRKEVYLGSVRHRNLPKEPSTIED